MKYQKNKGFISGTSKAKTQGKDVAGANLGGKKKTIRHGGFGSKTVMMTGTSLHDSGINHREFLEQNPKMSFYK